MVRTGDGILKSIWASQSPFNQYLEITLVLLLIPLGCWNSWLLKIYDPAFEILHLFVDSSEALKSSLNVTGQSLKELDELEVELDELDVDELELDEELDELELELIDELDELELVDELDELELELVDELELDELELELNDELELLELDELELELVDELDELELELELIDELELLELELIDELEELELDDELELELLDVLDELELELLDVLDELDELDIEHTSTASLIDSISVWLKTPRYVKSYTFTSFSVTSNWVSQPSMKSSRSKLSDPNALNDLSSTFTPSTQNSKFPPVFIVLGTVAGCKKTWYQTPTVGVHPSEATLYWWMSCTAPFHLLTWIRAAPKVLTKPIPRLLPLRPWPNVNSE